MKKFFKLICTALCIFSLSFLMLSCNSNSESQNVISTTKIVVPHSTQKLLRHVVLFNFNDKATDDVLHSITDKFASLPQTISEIHSFEWGTNNSPEGLDKGLSHCFLVTFLSEEDRDKYLPHPAHQGFVKFIGPYIEDVTVVDYWTT